MIYDYARYEDFRDRGRFINPNSNTPAQARRNYPYPDRPQLQATQQGNNTPIENGRMYYGSLAMALQHFISGDFEQKFVDLVRKTSARRLEQAKER